MEAVLCCVVLVCGVRVERVDLKAFEVNKGSKKNKCRVRVLSPFGIRRVVS